MPAATNLQASFLGGEISQSFQGRYDRPDYKISLATCLNWFPIETGALVRRGGTQFIGTTRSGKPGRVMAFDVAEANPIYLEFTDNFLRFYNGTHLITTNAQLIVSISNATPAVVTTQGDSGWQTGDQVYFFGMGPTAPGLQNRQFTITRLTGTTYSLADAITGASINGAAIGSLTPVTQFAAMMHVQQLATNYGSGSWSTIRSVQTETQTILLNGSHPQVLSLTGQITIVLGFPERVFSIAPVNFIDGPYLAPFPGSIITSFTGQTGNITLTLGFQTWLATTSYSKGDFVTLTGQGYQSLTDANLNNTPPNASFWLPVNAGAPVGPNGFTGGDIGRHIRLFSEPPAWNSATAYTVTTPATIVKYNGAYFAATASSTNVTPGSNATDWAVVSGAAYAVWTWGKITAISGAGLIAPGATIGSYTNLADAFNGTPSQTAANSATQSASVSTFPVWNSSASYSSGVGVYYNGNLYRTTSPYLFINSVQNTVNSGDIWLVGGIYYKANGSINAPGNVFPPNLPTTGFWTNLGTGNPTNTNVWTNLGAASAASLDTFAGLDNHLSPKAIDHATVYPSLDQQFGTNLTSGLTFNLRASNTNPGAVPSAGTLLGSSGLISNTSGAVTIASNDNVTSWNYAWVEMVATVATPLPDNGSHSFTMTAYLSQAQFFQANVNNGSVITIQLVGPPLLYPSASGPINTWRAGLYSDAAGWPTCGTYAQGRLWLAGVVDNRFDASGANTLFNFAPTGPDGTVADSNAISETLNAPDVNPILWMLPDSQGVLMGTQKREWLVNPASISAGLSPTNIVGNPTTHLGSAFIEPKRTEHTIVFVQKHQRKIMELFADVFSGKFSAPNLLDKNRALTVAAIQEIAYQQELTPTIWARCGDGSWFGITYKRDTLMTSQGPTFYAPHRHALGSGRIVESITVGPDPSGTLDALMMVTNDPATGVRHVELMTAYFEETNLLQNTWQLDDAVTPTSFTISNSSPAPYGGVTLNGLTHLNGKTVQVFAGGLDCGVGEGGIITDFMVSNGSVTVPFGDGVSAGPGGGQFTAAFVNSFTPTCPFVVGFTFNSDAQRTRPMEPPETGARSGPALGKFRRNAKYGIQVVNTTGLSIGTSFAKIDPVSAETPAAEKLPVGQLFSGVIRDAIDDIDSLDGQMCWRVSRPWPAMITAVSGFLETQDE